MVVEKIKILQNIQKKLISNSNELNHQNLIIINKLMKRKDITTQNIHKYLTPINIKLKEVLEYYNKKYQKKLNKAPPYPSEYCFNMSPKKGKNGQLWKVKKLASGITRWTKEIDSSESKDEKKHHLKHIQPKNLRERKQAKKTKCIGINNKLTLDMLFDEKCIELAYTQNQIIATDKKTNKKYTFDKVEFLDSGGYANIYLFKISNDDKASVMKDIHEVAIKEDTAKKNEYEIIKKMKAKELFCNVIPLREITNVYGNLSKDVNYVYIMKKVITLEDWLEQTNTKTSFLWLDFIISSLKKQMDCLMDIDQSFVYTDLKPQNIGLVCKGEDLKIKQIYLIDLGSAYEENDEYVGTLPCVKHESGIFKLKDNKTKRKCINVQLFFLMTFILIKYLEEIQEDSLCDDAYFYDSGKFRTTFFNIELPKRIVRLHKIIKELQRVCKKSKIKFDNVLNILDELIKTKTN